MDKILINLSIPSIGESYDFLVSPLVAVKDALPLIENAFAVLSNYLYIPTGNKFLCWKEKNILLDEEAVFASYGIGNGDHLLLI